MSGEFARMLGMFNARSKTGPVHQRIARGEGNVVRISAFNHPNVITGKDEFPGAVSREKTVWRTAKWTRAIKPGEPLDDVFLLPSFLEGCQAKEKDGKKLTDPLVPGYRKIVQPEYAYMVLGRPSAMAVNQLISREWVEAAVRRWNEWVDENGIVPVVGGAPTMGLDVAEFGVDMNVLTIRYKNFVLPQETWGGVKTGVTVEKAYKFFQKYEAEEIFIDSNG